MQSLQLLRPHDFHSFMEDNYHMTTTSFTDPYSKPSVFKQMARGVLLVLHRILPQKVYDAIYRPAFCVYQWTLRSSYKAKLAKSQRISNHAEVQRMERVLAVMPYSLIGSPGLEHTHDLAERLVQHRIKGAYVECGVAQGGCAALIAMVAASEKRGRHCWFFDSFEGLPAPTDHDFFDGQTGRHIRPLPRGSCLGTQEQVSQLLFDHFGLCRKSITLVKGWFQDTLATNAAIIGPIALLRIDGDWYNSTKCCLETLYDQIQVGGSVIIDDYCSCYGAKKATDEFLQRRKIQVTLEPDGRGGCSFQKPALLYTTISKSTLHVA